MPIYVEIRRDRVKINVTIAYASYYWLVENVILLEKKCVSGKEMSQSVAIKRTDYENAYIMISECEVFLNRAKVLYYYKDFSGSMEAIQHLIEWALKTLFVLSGTYSQKIWVHEPMEYFYLVENKLKPLMEKLRYPELKKFVFQRLKEISKKVGPYHKETLYGSYSEKVEGKYVPASKSITREIVDQFLPKMEFVYDFIKITILIFGYAYEFNSEQRDKELSELISPYKFKLEIFDGLKKVIRGFT